ncbi:hypothetical protein FALBO_15337 [Fusarium albosuccineum]|uniref:Uncharacterized protein n=1 Tax=Fusarium albosuccineum TaxID=1237068 RepID=A0A8H4P5E3_9HYPO|nr:hypothetical protein FALBO_15337 [Fusarium albosuccineum]
MENTSAATNAQDEAASSTKSGACFSPIEGAETLDNGGLNGIFAAPDLEPEESDDADDEPGDEGTGVTLGRSQASTASLSPRKPGIEPSPRTPRRDDGSELSESTGGMSLEPSPALDRPIARIALPTSLVIPGELGPDLGLMRGEVTRICALGY